MITITVFAICVTTIISICVIIAYRMYMKKSRSYFDLPEYVSDNFHLFAIIAICFFMLLLVINENCKIETDKIYTLKVTCFRPDCSEYQINVEVTEQEYKNLTHKSKFSKNGINLVDGKVIPLRNVKEFEVLK